MLQQFLHDFGYFALFLGTFFEGETILVLAGFLAFRGYMDINLVVVVAFFGSYAGDQLWYFLGRKHGRKLLARKPRWQLMGDRALEHIRKHPDIWVLSFRFVYGLRTVMPVAIGLSGYPPGRYLLLNGIGAAIWAAALAAAAYHFGAVLEGMLGSVKKYELWVLGALLVLGFVLWLRRRFKNARLARQVYADEQAAMKAERAKIEDPTTPIE
ncbi:DedA family protein [Pseudomonas sp. A-B-19]|uniref:DedA family protein n=1 Tax=Pseudomonas sp. A-B-19 TaxID=2832405 RepID=UPI001CC0F840|nr:DedA family protein [Pseudomonas sp. A-B-19]